METDLYSISQAGGERGWQYSFSYQGGNQPSSVTQSSAESFGAQVWQAKQTRSDTLREECCHFPRNAIHQCHCDDETEKNETWQPFELYNIGISGNIIRNIVWLTHSRGWCVPADEPPVRQYPPVSDALITWIPCLWSCLVAETSNDSV